MCDLILAIFSIGKEGFWKGLRDVGGDREGEDPTFIKICLNQRYILTRKVCTNLGCGCVYGKVFILHFQSVLQILHDWFHAVVIIDFYAYICTSTGLPVPIP